MRSDLDVFCSHCAQAAIGSSNADDVRVGLDRTSYSLNDLGVGTITSQRESPGWLE